MNKNTQLGSVSSSDLIDAKLEEHQLCGSKQCSSCGHRLEGKPDWVGLPAGVKFDPTDQELIEHLEAKVEGKELKSHPLIDEFIPTIDGEDGICYTHPKKLPGVTRGGLSRHFFHRPSKAYTTGTRKRRKIQTECDLQGGENRWHKTGKTRPVMVKGKQTGCKKILVLYTNFGKNRKPEKTNWVMHQYHLGQHEEEREGELVVSKIFYQTHPRQCNWSERGGGAAVNIVGEAASSERRESGSGSCSSSRDINIAQRDNLSAAAAISTGSGGAIPAYAGIDIRQLEAEHFGYLPFGKSFDEQGAARNIGEASMTSEVGGGTCEERDVGQHHVTHEHPHRIAAAVPSHSISTIISPPLLHHASIILDQDHSFHHVPRIILPIENFQQQEAAHEQQHHKIGDGRSGSGLEELIMGCNSSTDIKPVKGKMGLRMLGSWVQSEAAHEQQHHKIGGGRSGFGLEELIMGCTSNDFKPESSMANRHEVEWVKYSTFWPDPDNLDHHG